MIRSGFTNMIREKAIEGKSAYAATQQMASGSQQIVISVKKIRRSQ